MKTLFDVSYDIVTPESAEHGDAEERGYISEGSPLHFAIDDLFETRTSAVDHIECIQGDCYPTNGSDLRWVTVTNGMEFETGAQESRSLHLPDSLTPSTRRRIYNHIMQRWLG